MKLATYSTEDNHMPRIGIVVALGTEELLVDAARVPDCPQATGLPEDMLELLEGGADTLEAMRLVERFATDRLARATTRAEWISSGLAQDSNHVTFYPPIARPGKIIMVGGNYVKHNAEKRTSSAAVPDALLQEHAEAPPAFAKFPSVQIGHRQPLVYPRHTQQFDYEAELGVVIGRRCKDVPAESYADVVAGYTIVNDISMRDLQFPEMKRGSTMFGKNLDGAMPIGPYLVLKDEILDPQALLVRCLVNGEERQNDSTANMVFGVAQLIAHFSRMTLEPGDIISTGTPSGVGIFWNPPEHGLLHVGDRIEIHIEGLGCLENTVVAESSSPSATASGYGR
jgi:acylpyruvate hydrolase